MKEIVYEAYRNKEEIIYKYKLCRKNGVWQTKLYNSLLSGASVDGKVLAVKEELVKIHLNIDENQSEEEAFWFRYAPPSANIMYAMPSIGESVRLYFPSAGNDEPIITGCVRRNGETSDTTSRYFQTEHGSEIAILPGALNIKGGSKEPLSINFEDESGVTLTSPTGLNLNAGGAIIIQTPKQV
ncbi:phage baseplate assembly protein V [Clostridium sp. VAP51]|uniref:phage baseplate assembly protein V n=1 Tax=Clostridium sp. VAP51 TaxID=2949978 RepID=UPI00207A7420|nr:phage baseplate assembly protein V [Clostridium sp. VAP51]